MKVLVFHIGDDRYGLPLAAIARVLRAGRAQAGAPGARLCGLSLMDLHGEPVPVLDLSRLARPGARTSLVRHPHRPGRLPGRGQHPPPGPLGRTRGGR
ncbi:chemotaxis protein CheW [Massilia sp. H-1]|nr:chemotaxis protein CheW [Massilia sp. H-1]